MKQALVTFQNRELCPSCVEQCPECRRTNTRDRTWTHGPAHRKPCGVADHPQEQALFLYRCLNCGQEMTGNFHSRPCDNCGSWSVSRIEQLPQQYLRARIAPFCLDCHLYHNGARERRSRDGGC